MQRRLATHLVTLVVGLGLGVGAVAVASPGQPQVRPTSPDGKAIVREIKRTNRKLDILNRNIGGFTTFSGSPSLRALLKAIEHNTQP